MAVLQRNYYRTLRDTAGLRAAVQAAWPGAAFDVVTYDAADACGLWRVLRRADVVVSPHGFNMEAAMLFSTSPRLLGVVEVYPFMYLRYNLFGGRNGIAAQLGLGHAAVKGESPSWAAALLARTLSHAPPPADGREADGCADSSGCGGYGDGAKKRCQCTSDFAHCTDPCAFLAKHFSVVARPQDVVEAVRGLLEGGAESGELLWGAGRRVALSRAVPGGG